MVRCVLLPSSFPIGRKGGPMATRGGPQRSCRIIFAAFKMLSMQPEWISSPTWIERTKIASAVSRNAFDEGEEPPSQAQVLQKWCLDTSRHSHAEARWPQPV